MATIAKELGVSKDVVKYHKKSLNDDDWGWDNGHVIISPAGIDFIKSRLKKKNYDENFEKYTREKLKNIEQQLEYLDDFLIKKLVLEKEFVAAPITPVSEPEFPPAFTNDLKSFLGEEFIIWYCRKKGDIDQWADWRWDFVTIPDIQLYFDYRKGENL